MSAFNRRARTQGVSLLEALVSLVVMAIGAVGVLAMQTTLRTNADIAKQRSEAVRLAQARIEQWRGYGALTATAGQVDWTDIADLTESDILETNTKFTRTSTVVPRGVADDDPLSKVVRVAVSWTDRTGQAQSVELHTAVSAVPAELAGSLSISLDRSMLSMPKARHAAIPQDATIGTDGTSSFSPPGAPTGTVWVFDNTTGLIRSCPSPCAADGLAQFVTGFVRFALGSSPGSADAESPSDSPEAISVKVDQDLPFNVDVPCYSVIGSNYVQYFCAVPVTVSTKGWTGKILVDTTPLGLASNVADVASSKRRVCRYTPVRGCHPAVGSLIWGQEGQTASCSGVAPTRSRKLTNQDNPEVHAIADGPLVNQNFLVIRAGNGTTANDCPDDNPTTLNVQGTTWHHQPPS